MLDPNGNAYIAFQSYDPVSSLPGISLAKYDANGNQVWLHAFALANGTTPCSTPSLSLDSAGNLVVLYNNAANSVYVAVYNPNGILSSNTQLSNTYDGVAFPVRDASGNTFFLYDVIVGTAVNGRPLIDTYLAKITTGSNVAWATKIDFNYTATNGRPRVFVNGNKVYVLADLSDGTSAVEAFDGSAGNLLWNDPLTSNFPYATSMSFDKAGDAFIVGFEYGAIQQDQNAFVTKIAPTGTVLWTRTISTTNPDLNYNSDAAYAVIVDGCNNAYITGTTIGNMATMPSVGSGQSLFVLKMAP